MLSSIQQENINNQFCNHVDENDVNSSSEAQATASKVSNSNTVYLQLTQEGASPKGSQLKTVLDGNRVSSIGNKEIEATENDDERQPDCQECDGPLMAVGLPIVALGVALLAIPLCVVGGIGGMCFLGYKATQYCKSPADKQKQGERNPLLIN